MEKILSEQIIYTGRVLELRRREVELPDGRRSQREIVRHNGGAAVLPVDQDGRCYMVRQYRSAFERELLEIPAGKLEPGEDPYVCAVRELEEETGFKCASCEFLGAFYPTPGYDTEVLYLYLAEGLTRGRPHLDPDEFLSVETLAFDALLDRVLRNEIKDGKTVVSVLLAAQRLQGRGGAGPASDSPEQAVRP